MSPVLEAGRTRQRRQAPPRAWLVVAAAMFCIGWGGNQFTPLLIVYRAVSGYTQAGVDVFLGAYVVGLIPGLLVASALSDRYGRRPVMVAGLLASVTGSALLALGPPCGPVAIIAGRVLSGVAVGIAMAVGTTWVTELSAADGADGAGPRRSSIALTLGLGIGPGCAGALAQWAPLPLVLPYVAQIGLAVPALALLGRWSAETRFEDATMPFWDRLRVPAAGHRRFLRVVLPMAPWIFGSAGIAYAVVPQVVDARLGHWALLFTAGLTVATLGTGVAVQPLARRLDDASTARAVFVSMILMTGGVGAAALTAITQSPWAAVPVALLLGAAYGIAVVSGLLEVQRIARAGDLAGLTAVYYALAYVGFLLPAVMAGLAHWLSYPVLLLALAVLAAACTAVIGTAWSRHLPTALATPRRLAPH